MKAIAINGFGEVNDIEIADNLVKNIEKKAQYMKKVKYGTLLFIPTNKEDNNNYMIENCLYETLWTNKYEQLQKLYKDRKKPYEQISLF